MIRRERSYKGGRSRFFRRYRRRIFRPGQKKTPVRRARRSRRRRERIDGRGFKPVAGFRRKKPDVLPVGALDLEQEGLPVRGNKDPVPAQLSFAPAEIHPFHLALAVSITPARFGRRVAGLCPGGDRLGESERVHVIGDDGRPLPRIGFGQEEHNMPLVGRKLEAEDASVGPRTENRACGRACRARAPGGGIRRASAAARGLPGLLELREQLFLLILYHWSKASGFARRSGGGFARERGQLARTAPVQGENEEVVADNEGDARFVAVKPSAASGASV